MAKFLASLCEPNILIYDPLSQYSGFSDESRYIPKSDSLEEFDSVCRQLRAKGNITFFVEECERYIGQGKPLGENAFDLINRGRNWGIGLCAVTRRIQRLSKDYFDLCQHIFLFRTGLKSREYIADMIGWDNTRKVMRLAEYHFLHYNVETEESSVHVLKLGGAPKAVTQEEDEKAKRGEAAISSKGGATIESAAEPEQAPDKEQLQKPSEVKNGTQQS